MVIDWLVDENRQGLHGLKNCSKDHLGLLMTDFKAMLKEHKAKTFNDIPEDLQGEYASKDAWATSELVIQPSNLDEEERTLIQQLRDLPAVIPGRPDRDLVDQLAEIEIPFILTAPVKTEDLVEKMRVLSSFEADCF